MEKACEVSYDKSPKYRWVYKKPDESLLRKLRFSCSVSRPVAEILIRRGIFDKNSVNAFFDTPLRNLLNPFLMKGMQEAVERISAAIDKKEKICIYGDYDVDGVSSTALVYLFFNDIGVKSEYYVPNRLHEGYSLNYKAIDSIKESGCSLIITVDCGITSTDEIAYAKSEGIDVIVTDHHQPADKLPEDAYAIIDPYQSGDSYPFKDLAGVGVAYKLIMALKFYLQKYCPEKVLPNLREYLDIVALGTIADVVPLIGENRIFVKHGLEILALPECRVGLEELKKVTGLTSAKISAVHVGYVLAPRINAVGRLGSCDRGVKLLIETNRDNARWLAEELEMENKYRQGIERKILRQSYEKVERFALHKKYKGLVLYSEEWHPGVISTIASRVMEKYFRPTIIVTIENGVGKGSARSIPAFNLYDGLKSISDLLMTFGGHKYAAGIKVESFNIKKLQKEFHRIIIAELDDNDFIPELRIDTQVDADEINVDLVKILYKMRPFGPGNPEPVFCMTNVKKYQSFSFIGREKKHLKGFIEKNGRFFEIIGYNFRDYQDYLSDWDTFDILFVPEFNFWAGENSVQLKIKDIKRSE